MAYPDDKPQTVATLYDDAANPLLGQKLADGSIPVSMASDQPPIPSSLPGIVDAGNSTETPLGIGGTFTGTGVDTLGYSGLSVSIISSTNGGLVFQASSNGSNWSTYLAFTYLTANGIKEYPLTPPARYFRILWSVSGGVAQTFFRLQTILRPVTPKTPSHRVGTPILEDDVADRVKSVIVARNSSNFLDILCEPDGRLLVSAAASPPPDTVPILLEVASNMSSTEDTFFNIPNGFQAVVQQINGAGQSDSDGTAIETYYDPNGDLSVLTRIATGVVSGNSYNETLSYFVPDLGDGTRRILLRRRRLTGGAAFIAAGLRGYYQ